MKIALPCAHPLAARRRLPLTALEREPFVLVAGPAGSTPHDDTCGAAAPKQALARVWPNPRRRCRRWLIGWRRALGMSIVPAAIAHVPIKGVRYLDVTGVRLALGWREKNPLPSVSEFVALA